jgi:signal transduction histidine kinase/ligand-binding sensor domain-containing protein
MPRLPRALLTAVLLCAPAFGLTADRELTQYIHRIWQTQQGLPDGAITSILQDPQGYLWIATEAGLYRFDGERFAPVERLISGAPGGLFIRSAAQDSKGTLWLAGNDTAVYAVRRDATIKYASEQGMPGGAMQCIVAGKSGLIWACTERGLVRIDPAGAQQAVQVFRTSDGIPNDNVRSACEAPDGTVWLGGETGNITEFRAGRFHVHPLKGLPPQVSVRSLLCDQETIWIGTSFGLIRMHGEDQQLFTTKDGLVDDFVFSIVRGQGNALWFGTRSGFSRFQDDTWDRFRPEDGLSQGTAQTILEDRQGNLWVGTKRGLNQFADGRSIPYTTAEGLPSNETGPVLQDSSGVIWAGTLDAGLAHFDGRRFTKLTAANGLPSNVIRALAEDSEHALWVGTNQGLARIQAGRVVRHYNAADGLPSSDIRSLFRDRDGVIWVGTMAGLASLSGGHFSVPPGSPHGEIRAIGQDRDGNVVVGTEEGFHIQHQGLFQPLAQDGLYMRNANVFFLDKDGLLWVGMNGAGLRLINGRKITGFNTRDGLYDSELYGISVDDQDRMWIACSRGIFWVARSELLRYAAGEADRVTSVSYSPTEALRVIESRPGVHPALWRMKDGRLWFSTVRGLIAFNPASPARENTHAIVIEDPAVNGAATPAEQISELPGGQKNIAFTYADLSYPLPELVRFRYLLEGYDPDWVDAGTRREAFYTNLPPGNYTFRVKGCNFDGPCTEKAASVSFTLTPMIYQRVWFWPLVLIALAITGWLAYQIHIRRLRERYDLIVSERSRIARELHDTLIQGFSGITMALQALSTRVKTPEEKSTLQDIIADAATCLRETRQSVAGLRAVATTQTGLAGAISRAVREITETKDLKTELKLESASRELPPEMEYQVLRIVREAVNNAVKHADASQLEVSLHYNPENLVIRVKDDGTGFTKDVNPGPGHYGIIGMKERASQIGATIDLVTQPGSGTAITLTLPDSK